MELASIELFEVSGSISIVALEIFGQYIRVQDGLVHWLWRRLGTRWPMSFFIGERDGLIQQSGILWATEQAEPLLKHGSRRVMLWQANPQRIEGFVQRLIGRVGKTGIDGFEKNPLLFRL